MTHYEPGNPVEVNIIPACFENTHRSGSPWSEPDREI